MFGKGLISHLVSRVKISPLDDSAIEREKVDKVLAIAKGGELAEIHAVIGRVMMEDGRVGDALIHYWKGGRHSVVEGIAKGILDHGDGTEIAGLVEGVDENVTSPTIEFLKRYRDFHRIYQDKEWRAAAEMLTLLLTSNIAPKRFWMKLLLDALPLLEGSGVWFGTGETYELMRCLEECCCGDESEGVIRIALTRNLSRAIFTKF